MTIMHTYLILNRQKTMNANGFFSVTLSLIINISNMQCIIFAVLCEVYAA